MKPFRFSLTMQSMVFVFLLLMNFSAFSEEEKAADRSKTKAETVGSPLPPAAIDALGMSAEALSAKMILEELISRRYSQGMATFVDRQYFTVGAQLVLAQHPKPQPVASPSEKEDQAKKEDDALPGDLLLGALNIDEILKSNVASLALSPEVRDQIDDFVRNYDIKSVNISVGLKSSLGDEVKAKTDAWLKDRTKAEFGSFGVASVTYWSDPVEKKKDFIEQLNQFQGLAGQLALALAILIGMILWAVSSSKSKETSENGASTQATQAGSGNQANTIQENRQKDQKSDEEIKWARGVKEYQQKLMGLFPKLTKECETVIRSWCEAGTAGMNKLVCFAEAMGGELGRIPVPADYVDALTQAFSKMPEMLLKDKYDILVKIYWDLMMVVNLGTEPLNRPFAYLSNMNSNLISEVLIDQNAKMKTLVALFMSDTLREQYLSNQDEQSKLELLRQAIDLTEVDTNELKGYHTQLKSSLSGEAPKDVVHIDSALLKIVKALTPIEEIVLLGKMQGPGIEKFKRNYPTLAFIHEWSDDRLKALLAKAMPDEVVAYLKVKSSLQERVIGLCPPMTAEVAADDLSREDKRPESEQFEKLVSFTERLNQMVENGEVVLETIFPEVASGDDEEREAA